MALEKLSDDEVLSGLERVLGQSRRVESSLIAHLAEVDARHLFARYAAPSMFVYCRDVLHLSEGEAQLRILVARAAREHPVLLDVLADGRLHLSGIAKLAPILTAENREALIPRAVHKSKREIEEMLAELEPRPDVPSAIRKLPDRPLISAETPGESRRDEVPHFAPLVPLLSVPRPGAPPRPAFQPLAPARYKVEFTAGAQLRDKLERLRALMREDVPNGDLAAIIDMAVTSELERREARRYAKTSSPRKNVDRTRKVPPSQKLRSSRYLPAEVRRAVYRRDGGQCRFVDRQGRRCPERHRLEYHHRHPYGLGGGPDPDNLCLMCGPHNRYLAEIDYGRKKMSRYGRPARRNQGETNVPARETPGETSATARDILGETTAAERLRESSGGPAVMAPLLTDSVGIGVPESAAIIEQEV
jgi:hypothetical protein